jgi:hypothetical protein
MEEPVGRLNVTLGEGGGEGLGLRPLLTLRVVATEMTTPVSSEEAGFCGRTVVVVVVLELELFVETETETLVWTFVFSPPAPFFTEAWSGSSS